MTINDAGNECSDDDDYDGYDLYGNIKGLKNNQKDPWKNAHSKFWSDATWKNVEKKIFKVFKNHCLPSLHLYNDTTIDTIYDRHQLSWIIITHHILSPHVIYYYWHYLLSYNPLNAISWTFQFNKKWGNSINWDTWFKMIKKVDGLIKTQVGLKDTHTYCKTQSQRWC